MKIGVAGLGRMGAAIAGRLKEVGHDVIVWNRSVEKVRPLAEAGATATETPAELAGKSEIVVTILTDAPAIAAVYEGEAGLLQSNVAGKLFIDMSTVQPATEVALEKKVAAAQAAFVECPVGGTVGPARTGKLLGLVGGSEDAVARARPVLEQLCRRVEHVGCTGAGSSLKLAINLPLSVFWQSLGEAYTLCGHLGLEAKWLLELFADTSGGPNVLKACGPAIAAALSARSDGTVIFNCDNIRKDLRTMVAEARSLGFDLPITQRALAVYDQASDEGWGHRDCCDLPAYWSMRRATSNQPTA